MIYQNFPLTIPYVTLEEYQAWATIPQKFQIFTADGIEITDTAILIEEFSKYALHSSLKINAWVNNAIQFCGGVEDNANGKTILNPTQVHDLKIAILNHIKDMFIRSRDENERLSAANLASGSVGQTQGILRYDSLSLQLSEETKVYVRQSNVLQTAKDAFTAVIVSPEYYVPISEFDSAHLRVNTTSDVESKDFNSTYQLDINVNGSSYDAQQDGFIQAVGQGLAIEILDRINGDNNLQSQIDYISNNYVTTLDFDASQQAQDFEIENNSNRIDAIIGIIEANGTAMIDLEGVGGTITTTPNQQLLVNSSIRTPSNNPQFLNFFPSPTTAHFKAGIYGNFGIRFELNVDPVGGQDRTLRLNLYNATQGISLGAVKDITIPGDLSFISNNISAQLTQTNYTLGDQIVLRGQAVGANIITSNVSIDAIIVGSGGGTGGTITSGQVGDASSWGGPSVLASLNNSKTESDSQAVRLSTLDNSVVKLTGNQTIAGNKTFTGTTEFDSSITGNGGNLSISGNAIVSGGGKFKQTALPTANEEVANKQYVDNRTTPVTLWTGSIYAPNQTATLSQPATNFEQVVVLFGGDRQYPTAKKSSDSYPTTVSLTGTNALSTTYFGSSNTIHAITFNITGTTLTLNQNTDQSPNGGHIIEVYGIGKK